MVFFICTSFAWETLYILARVLITKGSFNLLRGSIYEAVKCHVEARRIAIDVGFKRLEISSLGALGLCKIELWEIREAYKLFEEIRIFAENNNTLGQTISEFPGFYIHPLAYWHCSAFLCSCLGFKEQAFDFAEKSWKQINAEHMGTWTLGHALIFLGLTFKNLNHLDRSFDMYKQALSFAQDSQYVQIQAKALYSIAEIYRERKDYDAASLNHLKSIQILERIDAKSNLAEAYYQSGLTYKAMAEFDKSNEKFREAIRLFSEMEAPKQVERVRQSMQNQNSN